MSRPAARGIEQQLAPRASEAYPHRLMGPDVGVDEEQAPGTDNCRQQSLGERERPISPAPDVHKVS